MCIRDRLWIQNEINQLYSKKNRITLDIYNLHLELTSSLHPITWNSKYNNIKNNLEENKVIYFFSGWLVRIGQK